MFKHSMGTDAGKEIYSSNDSGTTSVTKDTGEWNHLYCSSMAKKKTLLLPVYKAIHLWCYSKRPINHTVNAISSYIFNISPFPAWDAAGGKKQKLSRAYQLEVLQYWFHRRSQIQFAFFSSIPQTRYMTKAAHAGNLRPDKKYQKLVKLKQNRRDSKLPTTQGEVKKT